MVGKAEIVDYIDIIQTLEKSVLEGDEKVVKDCLESIGGDSHMLLASDKAGIIYDFLVGKKLLTPTQLQEIIDAAVLTGDDVVLSELKGADFPSSDVLGKADKNVPSLFSESNSFGVEKGTAILIVSSAMSDLSEKSDDKLKTVSQLFPNGVNEKIFSLFEKSLPIKDEPIAENHLAALKECMFFTELMTNSKSGNTNIPYELLHMNYGGTQKTLSDKYLADVMEYLVASNPHFSQRLIKALMDKKRNDLVMMMIMTGIANSEELNYVSTHQDKEFDPLTYVIQSIEEGLIHPTHAHLFRSLKDKEGNNIVHCACKNSNHEFVKLLADQGQLSHFHEKNDIGETPFDIVQKSLSKNPEDIILKEILVCLVSSSASKFTAHLSSERSGKSTNHNIHQK